MNDGGPAFPTTDYDHCPDGVPRPTNYWGMSLRDWLAGMALGRYYSGHQAPVYIAEEVYKIADAMLAERAKGADDETSA